MEKCFKNRNKNQIAEKKFKSLAEEKGVKHTRFGFDALDKSIPFASIDPTLRRTPDFIAWNKKDIPLFFEIKGFRNFIKIKTQDIIHYKWWDKKHKLFFWFYNCDNNTTCTCSLKDLESKIKEHNPKIKSYPENKQNTYYEIPINWFKNWKKI